MEKKYLMALDQGTTSSRCVIFDKGGNIVSKASVELRGYYPEPGFSEQDPDEILSSQVKAVRDALEASGISAGEIVSAGITNQRETAIVWNKKTGRPVFRAIVWQCRRTAPICDELKKSGFAETIAEKTGLVVDPYFSGTKIKWILDNVPGARELAMRGELAFGTVDSWLIYNLTGKEHVTDVTNASRTMLFDIRKTAWDEDLCRMLEIPMSMLPRVLPCDGFFGKIDRKFFGEEIPIHGVAGDQHASLFGHECFGVGDTKNTYGTGCFMLTNTGDAPVRSKTGLISTVAWNVKGKTSYALEGSVFTAGSVIKWLRDSLGLIGSAAETEALARSVENTNGVYFVPAFTGLGAPYWDPSAKGLISGITAGTRREHIVRAALESLAYQTDDVLGHMEKESAIPISNIKTDGGASANNFLMQFQSDISGISVLRSECTETTALGAAYLCGLGSGFYSSVDEISKMVRPRTRFEPKMQRNDAKRLKDEWQNTVLRAIYKGEIKNERLQTRT